MTANANSELLQQLCERIRRARDTGTPLRVRGGDTKRFYGRDIDGDELDLRGLDGVVSYDPTELVCTVAAGTTLTSLSRLLAENDQMLAFEPPVFGDGATIGGAVSAGLSGPRRPFSGSARDYVLGIDLINGDGQHLSFGGQVMKNVAGYDVSRLVVGALGTLGVITQVSLKVLPLARRELTLGFTMTVDRALETMSQWSSKPLPLSAAAHVDGRLVVRLSGSVTGVDAAAKQLGGDAISDGQEFWHQVRDLTHPIIAPQQQLWRLSVPAATPDIGLSNPQLIDWGGAQRWIVGTIDVDATRAYAKQYRGHLSFFRGEPRPDEVFQPLDPVLERVHRRLKASFDPKSILNPGRQYANL